MTLRFEDLDTAVAAMLARLPPALHIGAPLGLGKPHRLLNALYARVAADPARPMTLYTALSLDPPPAPPGLARRFMGPFAERQFGADFPRLAYVEALRRDALPAHVSVEEFYLQSGAMLGSAQAQRRYASLNYTHVARALADRGVNCIVQKVAANADATRLSLSSNTDLTFDAVDAIVAAGHPRPLLVAEIDPHLPWLDGTAVVDADWFDLVIAPPAPHPKLFALPRQPVGDAQHAIGLYASALVRDGGTLQIGIGALADALCHALALRHTDNAAYRRVLHALDPTLQAHPAVRASGGLEPFGQGLYGCSEMINEGFRRLVDAGVLRRKVVDKAPLMRRVNDGSASPLDLDLLDRDGQFLHGAFYLGSQDFYDWLHGLDDATRRGIGMKRVSEVNELYGLDEGLERLQRRDGRFFNTCMMATALGAAVSDGLEDGRVVSGVGGQYNFVAMAHALPGGRSALFLRATRESGGKAESNIRWNYGHTTIPRHLRDLYITEYGIADLRGQPDEDCVIAMAGITDARFAPALLDTARRERKLRGDFAMPAEWSAHTRERLAETLAPFRRDGTLPDYPLGSDFTEVEQRLVRALAWLQARTGSRRGKLATVAAALAHGGGPGDDEALARMDLAAPRGIGERIEARLLRLALARTQASG
ncbi:acetyl-CoA hydrolase/transferase C-terminal domain-containing protein [Luteimonas sp. M1R5S18]|uniref:Acetyl-CoA hydrolase/transferase C-terminal domain-containing protein n=1 Tax=Luteimonas rhizosphaericola TaxID=3042024 RepID=A0ABT6JMR7_9GAMM|nr:acetyl-CoA hydrolase/transferase C-terminal domain-containing protein [Luteimonas rhizosphaericola]MDH5831979.1 acetyl-CoA hydrolase/transferase C-terminal domain-containing protein [Luteimonas rhizosphaericola]